MREDETPQDGDLRGPSPTTEVGTPTVADIDRALREPRRVWPIELEADPNVIALILHVIAGNYTGPGRAHLVDLADALIDADRIAELRTELDAMRREDDVRRLTGAWREVRAQAAGDHRVGAWTHARFENEWRRNAGTEPRPTAPAWQRPTPAHLPYMWRRTVDALNETGIPWHVVQAEIRFVLRDGGGTGSFALVMRRCRKTLRQTRAAAVQLAAEET